MTPSIEEQKENIVKAITDKVNERRKQYGITPSETISELSGIAFGEHNVLAISLMNAVETHSVWTTLLELDLPFLKRTSHAIDEKFPPKR